VSLTVNLVREGGFGVTLIPHTLAQTTLPGKGPGARVNLEADLIGKYVEKFVAARAGREGLSLEFLAKHGFA
jgi:riboflavin synthase